jgi:hypothetical protein
MSVIAFQVLIKHTTVTARMILKYAQMSPKAVLHDRKNETKN